MSPRSADVTATVAVIGDGIAGSALARACVVAGLDVVLVGDDRPWGHTYGVWVDEWARAAPLVGGDEFARRVEQVSVWTSERRRLDRPYGVLDNEAVRTRLRRDVPVCPGRAAFVTSRLGGRDADHLVSLEDGRTVSARVVVDAGGWPGRFASAALGRREPAWQTAFGVVLPEPPDGDLGEPTLMDFRPVQGDTAPTTFAYALPVVDGWLVEETVLAARPAVEPVGLLGRLAARLGRHPDALLADAVRIEHVQIPMGGARPRRDQPTVGFGAAAGFVNPATGYSVTRSVLTAQRVAAATRAAVDAAGPGGAVDPAPVWDAVWPTSARRARALHDYGLERLVAMEPNEVREFFHTFFRASDPTWQGYLAADATGGAVASAMTTTFKNASGPMRRRLMAANPLGLLRAVRPR